MSPEYLLMEGARVHDESSQTATVSTEELTGLREEDESMGRGLGCQPYGKKRYFIAEGTYPGITVPEFSIGNNPSYLTICKRYIPEGYPLYGR